MSIKHDGKTWMVRQMLVRHMIISYDGKTHDG